MSDIYVISEFNAEMVVLYLTAGQTPPVCAASCAPYGQVFQALGAPPPLGQDCYGLIWTRPEDVIPDYAPLLESRRITAGDPARPAREMTCLAAESLWPSSDR